MTTTDLGDSSDSAGGATLLELHVEIAEAAVAIDEKENVGGIEHVFNDVDNFGPACFVRITVP
ncbi:hypothetical protein PY650_33065 [Rhizobium calliandrae]|uniref:Uncharacterized protein n=1 Tax=Rhizobium calliandrae TaxID=1312182 RepID=A0ABT7KSC4_9HYPH|nr:hypothetical protein [Rhizobium calliandrae]MDL2410348.1 hypothetical protein [Rhizobium calliandrae]